MPDVQWMVNWSFLLSRKSFTDIFCLSSSQFSKQLQNVTWKGSGYFSSKYTQCSARGYHKWGSTSKCLYVRVLEINVKYHRFGFPCRHNLKGSIFQLLYLHKRTTKDFSVLRSRQCCPWNLEHEKRIAHWSEVFLCYFMLCDLN